ncbi:MAG: hypothetical protein Q7T55_02470 [Solirubrobacteraceae bacterium]|nr:hypothetical protein [Solirubrobacteraceae bacterium]
MSSRPLQARPALRRLPLLAAALCLAPLSGTLAFADDPLPTPTPVVSPTAVPSPSIAPSPTTTPAPSPTPVPTPTLGAAATVADATWTAPQQITEEGKFTLGVTGTTNGQLTAHIALLKDTSACPTSPLYPMQTAAGTKVTVTQLAAGVAPTTPGALTGSFSHSLSLTPKDSGTFSLCGWLVGSPAANEASTVARFSQVVGVGNRPATLAAEIPSTVRSGDYFSVKLTGTTPAAGRRVLILAEKDTTKSCESLRKAPSGKLPLQTVVSLPSGSFTKTLRLRFRTQSGGPYLLCAQIVETVDRTPEATAQSVMTVSEGLKCVSTQSALSQRTTDLSVIRKRRDAALTRLTAAKKKVAPLQRRLASVEKSSKRRLATARKAVTKAKSASGKKKARARLNRLRASETKRVYKAGAPLRKAKSSVKLLQRTYTQYRTGASLLDETLTRTRKDVKKYCSRPGT